MEILGMDLKRKDLQRCVIARSMVLVSLLFAAVGQTQESHSADAVKAAYLYRFAGYISWPEESVVGHPFVIDVVGDPGVARELRHLLPGHQINKEVVEVRDVSNVQELTGAQMLYVGAGHADFLRAIAAGRIGTRPMLIVSEDERGLDLGSAVNFVTVDKRMRFEVSLTAAERAGLKISADLLSVAVRVHGGRRQSGEMCVPFSLPEEGDGPCGIRQALRSAQRPAQVRVRA